MLHNDGFILGGWLLLVSGQLPKIGNIGSITTHSLLTYLFLDDLFEKRYEIILLKLSVHFTITKFESVLKPKNK